MEIACIQFECRKIEGEREFFDHTEELLNLAKRAMEHGTAERCRRPHEDARLC